ncbi:MAG: hypothetical protein RL398_3361 [Planctomycetota bacterium]
MLRRPWLLLLVAWLTAACQTAADDLRGLADVPPLDYAVLVTGGAFRDEVPATAATFGAAADDGAVLREPIALGEFAELLRRGAVFRRVGEESGDVDRLARRDDLRAGANEARCREFLESARAAGYDLVLCVEELSDGPIEAQGINDRWPVTFATWVLLGIGMFIPDHTFESRATLRVTVRDLQSGEILHDPLLLGGPIDLSLVERSDLLGVVTSVVVPPFWVGDDPATVADAVRDVLRRRLLLSLIRDLKSESVRQRLRERSIAAFARGSLGGVATLQVDSREALSGARLRVTEGAELDEPVVERFARALLASQRRDGARFRYEAPLPPELRDRGVQALVATLRGGVASATFAGGGQ